MIFQPCTSTSVQCHSAMYQFYRQGRSCFATLFRRRPVSPPKEVAQRSQNPMSRSSVQRSVQMECPEEASRRSVQKKRPEEASGSKEASKEASRRSIKVSRSCSLTTKLEKVVITDKMLTINLCACLRACKRGVRVAHHTYRECASTAYTKCTSHCFGYCITNIKQSQIVASNVIDVENPKFCPKVILNESVFAAFATRIGGTCGRAIRRMATIWAGSQDISGHRR